MRYATNTCQTLSACMDSTHLRCHANKVQEYAKSEDNSKPMFPNKKDLPSINHQHPPQLWPRHWFITTSTFVTHGTIASGQTNGTEASTTQAITPLLNYCGTPRCYHAIRCKQNASPCPQQWSLLPVCCKSTLPNCYIPISQEQAPHPSRPWSCTTTIERNGIHTLTHHEGRNVFSHQSQNRCPFLQRLRSSSITNCSHQNGPPTKSSNFNLSR